MGNNRARTIRKVDGPSLEFVSACRGGSKGGEEGIGNIRCKGGEEIMCVEENLFHSVVERGVLGKEVLVYTKLVKVKSHALFEEVKSIWGDVKAVPFLGILKVGGVFVGKELIKFNNSVWVSAL